MEKLLYPNHPLQCIITGPPDCGKGFFLTNLISNIIIEYDEIYIYSPSLHRNLYQKIIICFDKFIPIHIIQNNDNEEDNDLIFEEVIDNKILKNNTLRFSSRL